MFKKKAAAEVNGDMTIGQVLEIKKDAAKVLMGFGMHCLGCPHHKAETVAEAASAHGIDLDLMLKKLNELK